MSPLLALALISGFGQQANPDPYANETKEQRDVRMKWFREARFGMFIHWGLYSVPAGRYEGREIGGIGEWIMNSAKIPTSTYQGYAKQFNPVKYDADAWVKLAKDAGMKYIVITSKHHDGFAMFDSKASDWNIMKATPFGRDPLMELSKACQKHGMRLGFYYSQAQDWNNPGGAAAGGHWDNAQAGDMTEYIKKVAVPQVKEILSKYGKISVLWWDTPTDMNKERADLLIPLLKLQPGIIHNNRLGVYRGDTETPEQFVPATGYPGRDWETCMTMNDTWGFKSDDHNWKSPEMLIRNLVDIASKGGNYLLNVGPTSLGEIPGPSIERLKTVGAWMKQNGKAIYATSASPFKKLPWGRATKVVGKSGTTLYLHVFDWPANGHLVIPGLKTTPVGASLLVGGKKLNARITSEGVEIDVPTVAPDKISSTVVLQLKGDLDIVQPVFAQKGDGTLDLRPDDAVIHGEALQSEEKGGQPNFGFWTNSSDWVEWQFQVTSPGKVELFTEVAGQGSSTISVTVAGQVVRISTPNTGSYEKFEKLSLGTFDLPNLGRTSVQIRAVANGWSPINLRTIKMTPAKQ